ncbi:hypothetical protein PVAP13_9NG075146 [Panicum virgatum]|uniref:Uncharacterized protein n=1 Tax=Panicum virgatum TaxID=38727 RepID=A0A8T0MF68_PANVG|nr:hypothetical protein PVAP13_9NG075146 [Panicum virgatum]
MSCAHEVLCLRTDWALVDPLHLLPGVTRAGDDPAADSPRRRRPSRLPHPSTPTASSTRARLRRSPRAAYRSPPRIRSRRGSSCIKTAAPSPRRQATLSSTHCWTSSRARPAAAGLLREEQASRRAAPLCSAPSPPSVPPHSLSLRARPRCRRGDGSREGEDEQAAVGHLAVGRPSPTWRAGGRPEWSAAAGAEAAAAARVRWGSGGGGGSFQGRLMARSNGRSISGDVARSQAWESTQVSIL